MTMTSEKLSTRRLELEQVKSLCKEEDHHPNMEVAIGSLQRKKELQVLSKKRKVHGTQLSQEEFLMSMLRKLHKLLLPSILLKIRELLPTDSWMITISEKHSMRKLELEQVKLPCKEVAQHPNMEEAIGLHQRKKELQVLSKKRKAYGTQLNLEKFLMSMSRQLLKLSPLNILLNLRELLPTDSWMTTTSEKPSTKRLGLELVKSPCKEEDLLLNTGKHHQLFSLKKKINHGIQQNLERYSKNQLVKLLPQLLLR